MNTLSVLICHLPERGASVVDITKTLLPSEQSTCESRGQHIVAFSNGPVEVFIHSADRPYPIGRKRNDLMQAAKNDYVSYVDDDDTIAETYVKDILAAIDDGPDCVGIIGKIWLEFNGVGGWFEFRHSIQYSGWYESAGIYYRTPNHLNPILREIAIEVPFRDEMNFGEDRIFSDSIRQYLKTENMVGHPIYYYTPSDRTGEWLGGNE